MSVERQKNIIKFEITVDDPIFVEVFQCKADLCGVESKGKR